LEEEEKSPVPEPEATPLPPPPAPDIIDILYGVIAEPNKTFAELVKEPRPWLGVAIWAGVMLASTFASGTSMRGLFGIDSGAVVGLSIAMTVIGMVFWGFGMAVTHFTAGLLGGQGSVPGLATVAGAATLPSVLSIPVTLITSRSAGAIGTSAFVGFGVGVWGLILSILAVKHNYRLSTGRSVAVVFLPVVLAIVAVIAMSVIIVVLLGTTIFKGIPRLPGLQ
jgi:hypothetical protein